MGTTASSAAAIARSVRARRLTCARGGWMEACGRAAVGPTQRAPLVKQALHWLGSPLQPTTPQQHTLHACQSQAAALRRPLGGRLHAMDAAACLSGCCSALTHLLRLRLSLSQLPFQLQLLRSLLGCDALQLGLHGMEYARNRLEQRAPRSTAQQAARGCKPLAGEGSRRQDPFPVPF